MTLETTEGQTDFHFLYDGSKLVGHMEVDKSGQILTAGTFPTRSGWGEKLYKAVAKYYGKPIVSGEIKTDAARAFWRTLLAKHPDRVTWVQRGSRQYMAFV